MTAPDEPEPIRDDEIEALICDCVDLLLPTLAPEQAEIVRMIDVEGALPRSVADDLGLSLDDVTRYLDLGRQGLTDRLGAMHMICPIHGLAGCDCHLRGRPDQ